MRVYQTHWKLLLLLLLILVLRTTSFQSYTSSNHGTGISRLFSTPARNTWTSKESSLNNLREIIVAFKEYSKMRKNLSPAQILNVISVLNSSKKHMSMIDISISLFHMRFYSDADTHIKELLSALTPKIKECKQLDAQAVGNAMYGLQSMSSDVDEVRGVLRELTPKIKECRETLSAQAVGNAMYGLQSVSIDKSLLFFIKSSLDLMISLSGLSSDTDTRCTYQTLAMCLILRVILLFH